MVPGLELVVGYLIAWATRKGRRAGARLDADADLVIDTELAKLHNLVIRKLGADPSLVTLEQAACAGMDVSERTRRRMTDALEEAVENDPRFADELTALLSSLARIAQSPALATGERATAVAGDVHITAEGGSAAAQHMGDVSLGSPPGPHQPGRLGG